MANGPAMTEAQPLIAQAQGKSSSLLWPSWRRPRGTLAPGCLFPSGEIDDRQHLFRDTDFTAVWGNRQADVFATWDLHGKISCPSPSKAKPRPPQSSGQWLSAASCPERRISLLATKTMRSDALTIPVIAAMFLAFHSLHRAVAETSSLPSPVPTV